MPRRLRPLVYGLVDPRTEEVRYVGKSAYGLYRAQEHKTPSRLRKDSNAHKANWVRQLLSAGLSYDVLILEEVEDAKQLPEREKAWISQLQEDGASLLNKTAGGEGSMGRKVSKASIEKMSRAKAGMVFTPEHRQALAKAQGGQPFEDHLGRRYETIKGAARQLGIDPGDICRVLKGKRKVAGGYRFRYL